MREAGERTGTVHDRRPSEPLRRRPGMVQQVLATFLGQVQGACVRSAPMIDEQTDQASRSAGNEVEMLVASNAGSDAFQDFFSVQEKIGILQERRRMAEEVKRAAQLRIRADEHPFVGTFGGFQLTLEGACRSARQRQITPLARELP